jgi:hypothetical protein
VLIKHQPSARHGAWHKLTLQGRQFLAFKKTIFHLVELAGRCPCRISKAHAGILQVAGNSNVSDRLQIGKEPYYLHLEIVATGSCRAEKPGNRIRWKSLSANPIRVLWVKRVVVESFESV